MTRWPHQIAALTGISDAQERGARRILLTGPTGSGKTQIMLDLADSYTSAGLKVSLYSNRKLIVEQTHNTFLKKGLLVGVRASGWDGDASSLVQISSIQTEYRRVFKTRQWELFPANLVLIDEAHIQKGRVMQALMDKHLAQGASIVGVTATPVDLKDYYDELVIAGTPSSCRQCGALVPAVHYGPDEPDLQSIKWQVGEDLSEEQNRKAIMRHGIFGRVVEHYNRLNPDRKPTLLFAPGVKESVWFAQQFCEAGIPAAHIDGETIWCDGDFYPSTPEHRQQLFNRSKPGGDIAVVTNRFVLREGVDLPWVEHGIFATVFGSLSTYLQSGGRLLRAFPGKAQAIIQDHGGNWHRHGSLNADRHWELSDTSGMLAALREDRLRLGLELEPRLCPECRMVILGAKCQCGYVLQVYERSRPVVQVDGTLRLARGEIYKPRVTQLKPTTQQVWASCYFRAKKSKLTFRQCEGLFVTENHYWPPRSLELMPKELKDWYRRVSDVPQEALR